MSQEIILAQALGEYTAGQLDEAEKLFRQVLSMDSGNSKAYYFLGLIASDKGVYDQAAQCLYQATLLEPNNRDYAYSLAVALQEDGKIQEAISIYEKIPDMPESWNNLGNIYMSQNDAVRAFDCFDKALKLNPKMIWAMVNKAILLRQTGKINDAVIQLQHALKIDDKFIPALYQLSVCYREQVQYKKALSAVQKALKNKDVPDFLYVEYGKVLALTGKVKDALKAYDIAISINRFCQDAYFEKAALLTDTDENEAEKTYRDLIRINPSHVLAYNNLGTILYNQGRVNEALEMYRQVVIIEPENMLAHYNLAVALEDMEEYAEAAGLYFNVLLHHQFTEQAHVRLNALLPKLYEKDKELALRYAEGWVKNFPDNFFALHTQAALSGTADTVQNNLEYTQALYDAFADTYEEKMHELECVIPTQIKNTLAGQHYKTALDLGCGTGLGGKALRALCDVIDGVDASEKMAKYAKEKKIYRQVYVDDIAHFFIKANTKYDLIVAADVFCYIYQLNGIFEQVFRLLNKGGCFAFTVEKSDVDTVKIIPQGRYQHPKKYIQDALCAAGFNDIQVNAVSLRKEGDGTCAGLLFCVHK